MATYASKQLNGGLDETSQVEDEEDECAEHDDAGQEVLSVKHDLEDPQEDDGEHSDCDAVREQPGQSQYADVTF